MRKQKIFELCAAELNLAAQLIIAFSDVEVPACLDGEESILGYCEVMEILGLPSDLPKDSMNESHGVFACDVPKYVRNTNLPDRVRIALNSWYTEYYLPRIRTIPQVSSELVDKLTEDEQDWISRAAAKVGLGFSDWVRDAVLERKERVQLKNDRINQVLDLVLRQNKPASDSDADLRVVQSGCCQAVFLTCPECGISSHIMANDPAKARCPRCGWERKFLPIELLTCNRCGGLQFNRSDDSEQPRCRDCDAKTSIINFDEHYVIFEFHKGMWHGQDGEGNSRIIKKPVSDGAVRIERSMSQRHCERGEPIDKISITMNVGGEWVSI